jgi:hypothetical protein
MAQLLIFTRNNTNIDPVKDRQCCYKIDDVVVVVEDAHKFGSAELLPPFRVEQIAGAKADFDYLLKPKLDADEQICCRRAYSWINGQAVIK